MTAAVVFLGGVAYTMEQAPADEGTAVTVATPATPAPGPPKLVVVGDSYSQQWSEGDSWPYLVAPQVGAELVNLSVGGSGYVRAWKVQSTFPAAVVAGLPADADVVVVFGGLNDTWEPKAPEDVAQAARATFQAVRRLAPSAALVVVGPQFYNASPPAVAYALRDVVRAEALAADATWLDPLAGAWLTGPGLIGPDGIHPSLPRGQQSLADRLLPVVADALAR